MIDGGGKTSEAVEIGDLGLDSRPVGLRKRCGRFLIFPFLRGFIQRFVVLVKFFFQRFRGSCLRSLALSRFEIDVSAPAMAKLEEASSLRKTSVISERWLAGSA